MSRKIVSSIIDAYDNFIVKLYCRIRFQIIHQRFLAEIGQYISKGDVVLDVGCGFGLFSLFYAASIPGIDVRGIDLNSKRIDYAKEAAIRLGIANVRYDVGDASSLSLEDTFDVVYMLDIIHHIKKEAVAPLLTEIRKQLESDGRLLIKDVSTRPAFKRWFTWLLDKVMDYRCAVHYWPPEELTALLEALGFQVYRHEMVDILPYPHILYICTIRGQS